jgi:hypothetical protein
MGNRVLVANRIESEPEYEFEAKYRETGYEIKL